MKAGKQQAISAFKYSGLQQLVSTFLVFLKIIVISRILKPEDFGLMAMVMVLIGFAQIIGNTGISEALIQRKNPTIAEMSSLYWFNVFSCWVVFFLLLITTPLVAMGFKEPAIRSMIPVAALAFLILPFGMQFNAIAQKSLDFRFIAVNRIISIAINCIVSIVSAWILHQGVWALIWGQLADVIATTGILVWYGWRKAILPRIHFRWADLRGYLSFGLYRTGGMAANFFNVSVSHIAIGVLMGTQALGYYSFAARIVDEPVKRLFPIISRITFPLFATLQDDIPRLKRSYFQAVQVVMFIVAPVSIGLVVIAPVAIPYVFGEKWRMAIPVIQILSINALLRSSGGVGGGLKLARGRADLSFYWNVSLIMVVPLAVYIGSRIGGIVHIASAVLFIQVLAFLIEYPLITLKLVGPCYWDYITSKLTPVIYATAMGIVIVISGRLLNDVSALLYLVTVCSVGAVVYACLLLLFRREYVRELLRLVTARPNPNL